MPTLTGPSSGTGARSVPANGRTVTRLLDAAYARERIEDVIRAIAEDALDPCRTGVLPWHDEPGFEDDLSAAVREIAAAAHVLLASRMVDLVDSAPPRVAGRLASVPRWPEQA